MRRIQGNNVAPGDLFKSRNTVLNEPGTIVKRQFMNDIQESEAQFIESTGDVVDTTDYDLSEIGDPLQKAAATALYSVTASNCITSGVTNDYLLSPTANLEPVRTYHDGMMLYFEPIDNTGNSTVNYNSLGVKQIRNENGTQLSAGQLKTNKIAKIKFKFVGDYFVLIIDQIVDTAANLASNNPVLSPGQIAFETDNKIKKIGDGLTLYNDLPYLEHEFLNVLNFGVSIGDNTTSVVSAITIAKNTGFKGIYIPYNILNLNADIDCLGLKIKGNNTNIPNDKTLLNHGGLIDCFISGVKTSKRTLHPTPSIIFRKPKVLRKFSANEYRGYTIANDGRGVVEVTWRDNIVDGGANSIGGTSAFRLTKYRNINDLAMLLTAISASTHTGSNVVRTFGGGSGGDSITYYRAAVTEYIEFDVGVTPINELSIAALITTSGSDSVEVKEMTNGTVLGTVNLKGSAEVQVAIKLQVNNLSGIVRLTNNDSGTNNMIVAGVNYFKLTEDNPQGDIDDIVFSFNAVDYTINQGANDFALARYGDLTGGSFHGGETILTDTFTVDGITETLSVGEVQYGYNIRHTTNVTVTWPSDSANVNVVRIESLADGMVRQIKEFNLGSLEFSSVWTMMSETNYALSNVRLAEEKGNGVGSSPLHITYDRTNVIQQDSGLQVVLTNYFTVYDDEANSNGGIYITDNSPSNVRKAYYGPVLFNKKVLGDITAEQITVFGL